MKSELLFIVNPVAGHGRSMRVFSRLESVMDQVAGLKRLVWLTRGPGHALELARRAALEGYDRIVAVGGDGTVHEAINGLMGLKPEILNRVSFGVVPAGSGNDFSRNLGIPTDVGALATLLASGSSGLADVGTVNGHYFANVAGVGFDAEVARMANRVPKLVPGTLTYVTCALAQLAVYRNAAVRLTLDGQVLERRALLVAVGNGARYAGGMTICPGARMDDGVFRVVVAGDLSRAQVLQVLPQVFPGRHVAHPLVEVWDAREVHVEADRPLSIQADGEVIGTVPATFRLLPRALPVIGLRTPEPGGADAELREAEGAREPAPETEASAPAADPAGPRAEREPAKREPASEPGRNPAFPQSSDEDSLPGGGNGYFERRRRRDSA
ncbi:YegS/Rv2252/BmrU family lipid kinase [Carboxydochorda subterranea]|uniref:YegS/Rv2252/BmrU family lipid kinase n=1 Tax=Carboxydichorda subterranea TaxID=3109565 RepID=A0ABZ1BWC1_9FIRM|nr:YegS/Rv2252/BmrU family lipid kinase [Limnochorda sp. L945t]WRP16979.1 YegS/Rv2252/BmrU family lipid kinase [Limnochorda sp. L945t]